MEVENTEKMPQRDPEHLIRPYFLLARFRTHPIPTESWTFKILTILIPQTSVITHEDRAKKSPFNVVGRLLRKFAAH